MAALTQNTAAAMWLLVLSVLLSAAFAPAAVSHEGRPVYIGVTEGDEGAHTLWWKVPPVLREGSEPLITLANSGCELVAGPTAPSLQGAKLYRCAPGTDALQVMISYPSSNPVLSTLLRYRRAGGGEYSIMAGPDEQLISLPETETFGRIAGQYTWSGFEHILEGYDHLLFVFCLVLLVSKFRKTLIVITGFTLGHSITLGMAALAQLTLPPTFVEPLIAFSVLILAVEKASGKTETLIIKHPLVIATGFGLLHGLGFGGALAEIGLPQTMQLQALAFFNIGVELGQALFVLLLFALYAIWQVAMKATRQVPNPELLGRYAIYPAGFIAGYWTLERVIGIWA